jgi:hypothetical protein
VHAPIHSGAADTGSHPAVEIHVDARALRVIDKGESEKDRAEVQKTMLGPEVLDSEHHQEIVFKSTGVEAAGATTRAGVGQHARVRQSTAAKKEGGGPFSRN